jgi:phosphatidylglycerol---prolipoprotein diacylglyceryl transferase
MVAAGITTQYYLENPLEAINTLNGGLGIPGAVAGGLLGLYLFTRRQKLNFLEWTDIVAPAVALGQAIGRWGNYVNQELYGAPTTLPWGLKIDRPLAPYSPDLRFHPLFLYESLANLAICGGLLYLMRRWSGKDRLRTGDVFLLYLIAYPLVRFVLDFIRLDNAQFFGLNTNQTVMLIVAVAAAITLVARHRRPRRYELKAQGATAAPPAAEPAGAEAEPVVAEAPEANAAEESPAATAAPPPNAN